MSWHFSRKGPLKCLEWAWPGGGSRAPPIAEGSEPGQSISRALMCGLSLCMCSHLGVEELKLARHTQVMES